MRQAPALDRVTGGGARIVTHARDYRAGYTTPLHFHEWDQLVYASHGVMTVRTSEGAWVVPAQRAVWIPEPVPHTVTMSGAVAMRTVYLKAKLARRMPRECCVVNVSPLLKELILHACKCRSLQQRVAWQRHLIEVIIDQFETIQREPLQLPNLSDPRSARVARVLMGNPGSHQTLMQIAKGSGASRRTVERLFQEEAGMTFGKWRQQLRLMHAMRLLGEGAKVTHAGLEAGYSTPSAFIAAFRRALGTTPTLYFGVNRGNR